MESQSPLDTPQIRAALLASMDVSQQVLSNWKSRGVPVKLCPKVEKATAGAWTCEQMQPDQKWVRVKDKTWPHKAGRPLLDVSATPTTQEA